MSEYSVDDRAAEAAVREALRDGTLEEYSPGDEELLAVIARDANF